MPELEGSYENATTTARSGDRLAHLHGYGNIALLAADLPDEANVLDLGAGASPFGREVVELRPDITWTNVDFNYSDPVLLAGIVRYETPNVQYIAGDATKLTEVCEPNSFDAVFSYWLFPHLSMDSPEPALVAARGVYDVLKQSGTASVGPQVTIGRILSLRWRSTFQQTKNPLADREAFAQRVLSETQLPSPVRHYRQFKYEVMSDYFGTTRWRKDGRKMIYSPDAETYVPTVSAEGLKIISGLGIAATRHVTRRNK